MEAALQEYVRLLEARQKCRGASRISFFKPYPWQARSWARLQEPAVKTQLVQAPNKVGKTGYGAAVTVAVALGEIPWEGGRPCPLTAKRPPVKIRVVGENWLNHVQTTLVPELKAWAPRGLYQTKRNTQGIEYFWTFRNGSTIELVTNEQDEEAFESWLGHFAWFDEPTQQAKYTAMSRGVFATGGKILMTFTPLKEAWMLDELVLSNRRDVDVQRLTDIRENPTLTEEQIARFEADTPEELRPARLHGQFRVLSGIILKEFDPQRHILDPFPVPTDWPVVAMVDLHLNLPQAIGFYATDPQERMFVVDEVWETLSPEGIAEAIIQRKRRNLWRLGEVSIDPLAKGDANYLRYRGHAEDTFTILQRKLNQAGIRLSVGSKDKSGGIRNLKQALKGLNTLPTLYVFRSCERHLFELQRWIYDERGEPKKEHDHFMENLYRFTLMGVRYLAPSALGVEAPRYDRGVV